MAAKPHSRSRQMIADRLQEQTPAPAFHTTAPPEALDERGMRRQTLYLPPEVYEQIRQITHTDRISQQKFFREAIDMAFAARGMKGWEELSPSRRRA
jgi:hypothetical protein